MAEEVPETQYRKTVVITGASSGVGRAAALEFARQGYDVVLTARRKDELEEAARECREQGVDTLAIAADTTDEAGLEKVAAAAVKTFGSFDIWVNDAGVSVYGKFLETPTEDFRRVIDTNLMGYVHGSRIALRQFRRQGHGTLINISSVNAMAPVPYASAYVTSKYAVRGLSESLRLELELDGLASDIHVCTVMPASIDTNLFQNAANYSGREVRPLEPVYEPSYVARHIVRLAEHPRRELIVGPAGKLMAAEFAMLPSLYEKIVSRFVDANHLGDSGAAPTHGNLYQPVDANSGIGGGWRDRRLRADTLNTALGAAAAVAGAIGLGMMLARRRHHA